jgi:hypothetical protein
MNVAAKSLTEIMSEDLAKSGLVYTDMMARLVDEATKEAISFPGSNLRGYVIPYFDIYGKMTQYYRVRVLDNPNIKYLQIKGSPNHVYFPKNFQEVFNLFGRKLCIMTEGEKKAALCAKMGIPAVAFGGVDSWQNKTIIVPKQSEISSSTKALTIKLPSANMEESNTNMLAKGFQELVDLGLQYGTTFLIAYDRDTPEGMAMGPQRAASKLGFELRFKGLPMGRIRQLVPPWEYSRDEEKSTLEDILLHPKGGKDALLTIINDNLSKRTTFPRHPSVREYIAKQLQKPRLDRKQAQNVSLAVLTDLDYGGTRMYSKDEMQMFYFSTDNNHLMPVNINKTALAPVAEQEFGQLLYRKYSVSVSADTKLMQWLGSQYAAEEPIEYVTPYKVIARPRDNEDIVRFQINNGQYIKVGGDPQKPYQILPNGAESVLFESQNNQIDDVVDKELIKELQKQHSQPIKFYWGEVLKEVRLRYPASRQGDLIALLYYISPYLFRWRGLQLPVEIIVGEAGSGKSTLCEIRLNILTGDPQLRNSPKEQKDWYASLASSGGLHVIDNVQMTDKSLRQSISDELCRVITEKDPRIMIRKYFTEADERTIRINTVFAFTAIQMPFQNADLLQRSVVLELAKTADEIPILDNISMPSNIVFDGSWKDNQLTRFGGRTGWIAHQMHALHLFFKLVNEKWDHNYKAKHRLVHLEQSLVLMAEVFGGEGAGSWIPDYLASLVDKSITGNDWVLEGLIEWANIQRAKDIRMYNERTDKNKRFKSTEFSSAEIAAWAASSEEYEDCHQLTSSRSLGRYMTTNEYTVAQYSGIIRIGLRGNKVMYTTRPTHTTAAAVDKPINPLRHTNPIGEKGTG